jgi:ADP-ribosylation factor GTPase-activating protein 1
MAGLSKAWSMFSLGASTALETAVAGANKLSEHVNDNYVKPASEAVRDPDFQSNVNSYVSTFTRTVGDASSRGMSMVSSYINQTGNQYSIHEDDSLENTARGHYYESKGYSNVQGSDEHSPPNQSKYNPDDYYDDDNWGRPSDYHDDTNENNGEDAWKSKEYETEVITSSNRTKPASTTKLASRKGKAGGLGAAKSEAKSKWDDDDNWSEF